MHAPQVSIVMAAYNHARYIDKAIASALAQTWQDFELIVVDDGSVDATGQVVSQFGDPVRYIFQQNRGQGGARNRGIANTRGHYLCFLDDDDLWEPEYLATVMSVFQQHPLTDALYTGYRIMDGEGKVLPQRSCRVVPPHEMLDALTRGGWFPPLVVTVRKACLDEVGPLDETLRGNDDWDLWLRIARKHTFRGIPELLARYRIHAGGLSVDVGHMLQDQKRAVTKQFGPEEGDPASWPRDRRRAYGTIYRTAALAYIQSGDPDEGRRLLRRAVSIDPDLLRQFDLMYELALDDQPRGYRGDVTHLSLPANAAKLLHTLDVLLTGASAPVQSLRRTAYGNAFLTLGMLSDQFGDWAAARRYMVQAVSANPRLLASRSVTRRFVKLSCGKRLADGVRGLRRESRKPPQ